MVRKTGFPPFPGLCMELDRKKPRSKPTTTSKKELIRWNLATLSLAGSFTITWSNKGRERVTSEQPGLNLFFFNSFAYFLRACSYSIVFARALCWHKVCYHLAWDIWNQETATQAATDKAMRRRIPIIFQRDDLVQTVPAKFCQTLKVSKFRES